MERTDLEATGAADGVEPISHRGQTSLNEHDRPLVVALLGVIAALLLYIGMEAQSTERVLSLGLQSVYSR